MIHKKGINIEEILFWFFLGLGLYISIKNIFGIKTPFIALTSFIFAILFKLWVLENKQNELENYLIKTIKNGKKNNKKKKKR